jgi:S-(hydroxymethyl)glutathione dehydrogenase/alcohol dehydrogenase
VKTNAAICWEVNADWSVEEIDIDPPQEGEVLVSFEASGLVAPTNTSAAGIWQARRCPWSADTKAPGIVQELGPSVHELKVGDYVVGSFLPACGRCRWCANGKSNHLARGLSDESRQRPPGRCTFANAGLHSPPGRAGTANRSRLRSSILAAVVGVRLAVEAP